MSNVLLYVILVVAIAVGYLLGRRERKRARPQQAVIKDYYQGLNFLLSDRPELGVERFIEAMEVSDDTVDVHLAMASVVRRRGEVDKAIRIHQNMLAMPNLNRSNKQLAEFELARDYHVAGLLDRAENLLTKITDSRHAQEKPALELLLDLYEQEREWGKAIVVGEKLLRTKPEYRQRVAHFHCEIATEALDEDLKKAHAHIKSAIAVEPNEPRGHWLFALLEQRQKRYKQVLKHIQKAAELKPELVGEYLETFKYACDSLNDDEAYERFLSASAARHPHPKVMRALINEQRRFGKLSTQELTQEIARAPVLEHVPLLLEMAEIGGTPMEDGVREQIHRIVKDQARLQCGNCGFTTHTLMWHCPTCKHWGSFT